MEGTWVEGRKEGKEGSVNAAALAHIERYGKFECPA